MKFLLPVLLLTAVFVTARAADDPVAPPLPDAVGGGWTDGGALGAYFANPNLAGEPAFTRRDVRVAFDWGKFLPVGGSTTGPLHSFPRQNFSVRWTGGVLPKFREDYTFAVTSASGVRLKVKPDGAADWKTLVDSWEKGGTFRSDPVSLVSGKRCEVVLEYRQLAGPAAVELRWGSSSAPEQVIDPAVAQGLNLTLWQSYIWADAMKTYRFEDPKTVDSHGFPNAATAKFFIGEGGQANDGVYGISFNGQAEMKCFASDFQAGGETHNGTLPKGSGYNPANDTTTATVENKQALGIRNLVFNEPSHNVDGKPVAGITDLRIMRPLAPGSPTPHNPGDVIYAPMKKMLEPYTCVRWLQIANIASAADWDKRSHVADAEFSRGGFWGEDVGGECWEMLVMLANESGKDLYATLPVAASDAYIEKFANLIRYGSDGVEPYTQETENPTYPPLNPNLRLYVEVGNEIWNWSFGSTTLAKNLSAFAVRDSSEEGKIINYDGAFKTPIDPSSGKGTSDGNRIRRWVALRSVRATDVFRRVMGDSAIGSRIRPLLESQYQNSNNNTFSSLNFLDRWFNNGDGDHVSDPHPVRHWIWGAGAATYYGVGNETGKQDEVAFPDPGFDAVKLEYGAERPAPAGSPWKSSGAAAIYRTDRKSVVSFTPGVTNHMAPAKAVGCTIRVDKPLYLRALGAWMRANVGVHPYTLMLIGPDGPVARTTLKSGTITDVWYWGQIEGAAPQLIPGVDYHLLATNAGNPLRFFVEPVAIVSGEGFQVTGAVRVAPGAGEDPKSWNLEQTAQGALSYGPLSVMASESPTSPEQEILPQPTTGDQAAVLRAGGELTSTVNFPKPGKFALRLNAAGKVFPYLPFSITVDGNPASPMGQRDERAGPDFVRDGFGRSPRDLNVNWGSAVFTIEKPGPVEIKIRAADKGDGWMVFDNIEIASVDALIGSGFGAGQANGGVKEADYIKMLTLDGALAKGFGLEYVAYEAGWSLGGDIEAIPLQTWCKFADPRVEKINDDAQNLFTSAGGFMNVWGVYIYCPQRDMLNAISYPLMKSITGIASRLPEPPTNGVPVPGALNAENATKWSPESNKPALPARGDWKSWAFLTPDAGVWNLTVTTSGEGSWDLEVDGMKVVCGKAGETATVPVRLVGGQHGARLRNTGGSLTLQSIDLTKP